MIIQGRNEIKIEKKSNNAWTEWRDKLFIT